MIPLFLFADSTCAELTADYANYTGQSLTTNSHELTRTKEESALFELVFISVDSWLDLSSNATGKRAIGSIALPAPRLSRGPSKLPLPRRD
jgi:hypothetical protein